MQACGISLYRAAAPLLVFAVVASGADVRAAGAGAARTRTAAPRRSAHVIRGGSPRTFDVVNRKWLVARDGDIYNYTVLRPAAARAERPVDLRVRSRRARRSPHAPTSAQRVLRARERARATWRSAERLDPRVHADGRHAKLRDVPGARPAPRAARLLRDRVARRRPHDLRAAAALHHRPAARAASTSCRRRSRCTASSRSRS